jgi:purine-nucleoside phosphorylase
MDYSDFVKSAEYMRERLNGAAPKIAVILGSGLGDFAELLDEPIKIEYKDIHGFATSTALSHEGKFYCGKLSGTQILVMKGRFHYYEGYEFSAVAYPIWVFKLLGIEKLIITNSAGGINEKLQKGDLVLITDHIKLVNDSPLRGKNIEKLGERFFDMTTVYDKKMQNAAKEAAKKYDIELKEGVYAYMAGPQYETPAEIKALRILGADVVGMSTVSEVIAAAHAKLSVLCISLVTNLGAGMGEILRGEDVTKNAAEQKEKFAKLLIECIKSIS